MPNRLGGAAEPQTCGMWAFDSQEISIHPRTSMKRGATRTELMNRHCVVCGGEFGPHLKRCCTDRSLVATATVGFFKKEKKFFTLDGTPLTQRDLEELRRVETDDSRTAKIAAAPQRQSEQGEPGTPPDIVDTATLHDTTVVPSLASPLPPGKNAIWCASLGAAWERLAAFLGEPVQVDGVDALCADLNRARTPSSYLPIGDWYAAAGVARAEWVETIRREMRVTFPNRPAPVLEVDPENVVAFGYLQCLFQFPHAYEDSQEPLEFRSGSGGVQPVRSFGVREEDRDARWELREQVQVLFGGPFDRGDEFALDLCRESTPVQVVVARIRKGATLSAGVEEVEARSVARPRREGVDGLECGSVMLVPNMNWDIRHHFPELSGRRLNSSAWAGKPIDVWQDIRFRLDRRGVALTSETRIYTRGMSHDRYVFDGPFLLYVKRRDATTPFFAMWVETPEVLEPFGEVSGR